MFNQNELSAVERFVAPTPKFQKSLQVIGIVLAGLAALLMKLETDQLVNLPSWLAWVASKATAISGIIAVVVAQFSVDYKAKATLELLDNV